MISPSNGQPIMHQLHIFFNAWVFYTRLPAPAWVVHSSENLNHSSRYFPLIGALLAGLFFGAFVLANQFFSIELSLLMALVAGILATGAFHEDGFADLCDGFGGGWQTEDVLRIMKDSRLGTYGVIGLWSILTLKWTMLLEITHTPFAQVNASLSFFLVLLCGFMLSRAWSISLIALLPYVQLDEQSKAKPIAKEIRKSDLGIAWLLALMPLCFIPWASALTLLGAGLCTMLLIRSWFNKRLGGYTGDALGASQQIQELTVYMAILAVQAV